MTHTTTTTTVTTSKEICVSDTKQILIEDVWFASECIGLHLDSHDEVEWGYDRDGDSDGPGGHFELDIQFEVDDLPFNAATIVGIDTSAIEAYLTSIGASGTFTEGDTTGTSVTFRVEGVGFDLTDHQVKALAKSDLDIGVTFKDAHGNQYTKDICLDFTNDIDIYSPIALDLNGDGEIGVTGNSTAQVRVDDHVNAKVWFDLDADGSMEKIEWMSGDGDGLLVDNTDGNAAHDMDGARLFGDQGGQYTNGFNKLAERDANDDGKISGDELNGLEVWIDDGDARVQDGEFKSLDELNITSLDVDFDTIHNANGEALIQSTADVTDETCVTCESDTTGPNVIKVCTEVKTKILIEDVWFASECKSLHTDYCDEIEWGYDRDGDSDGPGGHFELDFQFEKHDLPYDAAKMLHVDTSEIEAYLKDIGATGTFTEGDVSGNYVDFRVEGVGFDLTDHQVEQLAPNGLSLHITFETHSGEIVTKDVCIDLTKDISIYSPIALDLNGDGKIGVTGNSTAQHRIDDHVNAKVWFDLDADGSMENIEWLAGDGDGLLIDNTDGNAASDMDGSRLFGDQGGLYNNGFEKLALRDANNDGVLTGDELDGLEIWVDDGDAKVEGGEFVSLADENITEISVGFNTVHNARGEALIQSHAYATEMNCEYICNEVIAVDDDLGPIINTTLSGDPVSVGNALDNDSDPQGHSFGPLSLGTDNTADADGWFGWLTGDNGGEFRLNETGEVEFRAGPREFTGLGDGDSVVTSIEYQIVDEFGASDTAVISVTVNGNTVVAEDDENGPVLNSAIADGSTVALTNALTNDFDPQNDLFGPSSVGSDSTVDGQGWFGWEDGDQGGEFRLNIDGSVEFRADPGEFDGLDFQETLTTSISYEVTDEFGATDIATISVDVEGDFNDVTANDDVNAPAFNTTLVAGDAIVLTNALLNDSDAQGNTFGPTALNADTTVDADGWFGWESGDQGGEFRLNTDGSVEFRTGAREFTGLAGDESVTTSVTYEITDEFGATDTATISMEVVGNDVVAEDDDTGAFSNELLSSGDVVAIGNALTNDSDPQGHAFGPSSLGSDSTPDADGWFGWTDGDQGGEFRLNTDGSVEFRNDPGEFDGVAFGQTVTTSISYEVTDEFGATDVATISLDVEGTANDVIANDDINGPSFNTTLIAGEALVLTNALLNDSDPEGHSFGPTALSLDTSADADGWFGWEDGDNGGEFRLNTDGSVEFRTDPNEFDGLGDTETVTTSIEYTITDEFGATDTATISMDVAGNSVVAEDDDLGSVKDTDVRAGEVFDLGNALDNDSDPQGHSFVPNGIGGDTEADADGWFGWEAGSNGGEFRLNETGDVEFRGGPREFVGLPSDGVTTEITYSIIDEFGAEDTATMSVNVAANSVIAEDDEFSDVLVFNGPFGKLDFGVVGNALPNDSDPEGNDFAPIQLGDSTSFDVDGWSGWEDGDNGGEFRLNKNGDVEFRREDGEFEGGNVGDLFLTSIDYAIKDEFGAEDEATITLEILIDEEAS